MPFQTDQLYGPLKYVAISTEADVGIGLSATPPKPGSTTVYRGNATSTVIVLSASSNPIRRGPPPSPASCAAEVPCPQRRCIGAAPRFDPSSSFAICLAGR